MPRTYIPRSDQAYRPSPRSKKPIGSSSKKNNSVPAKQGANRQHPILSVLLIMLLIILCGGVFYGLNRWDYFEIRQVEIVGTDRLAESTIEGIVLDTLLSTKTQWRNTQNIFLVPQTQIENRLVQEHPSISSVRLLRRFPDTLVVIIEERYPVFELCSPANCVYLANDGVAIAHTGGGSLIPIRRERSSQLGEQVFSQRTIDWLEYLVRTYTIEVGLTIESIEVVLEGESGILEIAVLTQDGYQVRFDFETDLVVQKNALQVVFEAEIPEERRSELEYIDLRVPNRVYYKFRESLSPSEPPEQSEEDAINTEN